MTVKYFIRWQRYKIIAKLDKAQLLKITFIIDITPLIVNVLSHIFKKYVKNETFALNFSDPAAS